PPWWRTAAVASPPCWHAAARARGDTSGGAVPYRGPGTTGRPGRHQRNDPQMGEACMPTTAVRGGGVRRMAGGLAAAAVLGLLVAGLPVALVRLAGNPLPDDLPAVEGILAALTTPDDGTLFLAVLTAVGWLAWAAFTGSVALEVAARAVRRRTPSIPGLAGPQRLVSALVAAVAALPASPTLTGGDAAFVDPPPALTSTASPAQVPPDDTAARPTGRHGPAAVHVVVRGEGLLDLQDRYGVPWQRIAEANYGVRQPDGQALER